MTKTTGAGAAGVSPRERLLALLFILAQVLTVVHFVHEAYVQAEPMMPPGSAHCFFGACGQQYAPTAYRLGVQIVGTFLVTKTHTQHPAMIAALLDLVFFLPALLLFCATAIADAGLRRFRGSERMLAMTLFLALAQFPLSWVVPWQRSETAPTSLFVAGVLFWLTRRRKSAASFVLLFAMVLWQSFVRADLVVVTGFCVILLAALGDALRDFGTRRLMLAVGAGIALVGCAVQFLLQFVLLPHLSYAPGVQVVMLGFNLSHPHMLTIAALVIGPFAVFLLLTRRVAGTWDSVAVLAATLGLLYGMVWLTVGLLQEARVYVPVAFALAVATARTLARFLNPTATADTGTA